MTPEIAGLLVAGILGDVLAHARIFIAGHALEEATLTAARRPLVGFVCRLPLSLAVLSV